MGKEVQSKPVPFLEITVNEDKHLSVFMIYLFTYF